VKFAQARSTFACAKLVNKNGTDILSTSRARSLGSRALTIDSLREGSSACARKCLIFGWHSAKFACARSARNKARSARDCLYWKREVRAGELDLARS
jgi:hypothetical protein